MENMPKAPMKDFWSEEGGRWYLQSCAFLDYPKIPLQEHFDKLLRPGDTVLDLGCGYGVTSLYLARQCRRVYALDFSERAVGWLRAQVEENEIANIVPVCDRFPSAQIPQCDVSVVLYVNKLIHSAAQAQRLLDATKREGLILINHADDSGSIHTMAMEKLGMPGRNYSCRNGCYIAGLLEAQGASVSCTVIEHDFGQPVADLEEATRFLQYMLHFGENMLPKLREAAAELLCEREGRLYLPNQRRSCLLHFKQGGAA